MWRNVFRLFEIALCKRFLSRVVQKKCPAPGHTTASKTFPTQFYNDICICLCGPCTTMCLPVTVPATVRLGPPLRLSDFLFASPFAALVSFHLF